MPDLKPQPQQEENKEEEVKASIANTQQDGEPEIPSTLQTAKPNSEVSGIHQQCRDLMRYAKPMPECFEKTYVRIIYLMSLLSREDSIDDILNTKTQQERLVGLKADLEKVQDLMKTENFEDTSTELLIKETVQYFKNKKETDYKFELQLSPLLQMLVKNIRPFNFQEFFELVQVCNTNSDCLKGQSIILLLGTTGAGKSTTIQYLFGAPMKLVNGHIQANPMPQELKDFVSSPAMRSVTRFINSIPVQFINQDRDQEEITIVDIPGFGDSQGAEVDISNTLGITRAVTKSSKVYPVTIFSQKNQGGRSEILKQQVEFYASMIKDINTVNFFFSHYSDQSKTQETLISSIIADLNPHEHSKILMKETFKLMEERAKQGKLLILNPLDRNYVKVLHQIMDTPAILNPKDGFNLNIMERSRNILDKQVALHERAIIQAVERGDTQLAEWKINELKQLADIFSAHEKTYQDKLENVVNQIKLFVTKVIDTVLERIQTCMKVGYQFDDIDIAAKFQEALAFERKLAPLIASINSSVNKSGNSKIFCDQHQSQMITAIISQCGTILTQLQNNHKINEDEWILFIQKTINIDKNVEGFEQVQKNALDKYYANFSKLAQKAQKIINDINISHYSEISQPQSQEISNDMHKTKATKIINLSNKASAFKHEDDEEQTVDTDMEKTDNSSKIKKQNVLSSSDQDQEIKVTALSDNKKATFMMKKQQEKVDLANKKVQMPKKFADIISILVSGIRKIKVIDRPEYIANLNKLIDEIYKKMGDLETKTDPYFEFHFHDGIDGHKTLNTQDITEVNQALALIENFLIACKGIDKELGEITYKLNTKYIDKCCNLFEMHYKFLIEALKKTEVKVVSASEVKERFEQIMLLRQIPQIENQTNVPYLTISIQLKNKINLSKNEIITIMQEFNEFTSIDSGVGKKNGLQNLFKRLKEALSVVKTLGEAASDKDDFMKKIFNDIQESFVKLISKLEYDAGQYLNLNEENSRNVRPVASIYEQIQDIYACSQIIDIEKKIRQDVGLDWIKAIKETLINIQSLSENLNGQLMVQADYRKFHFATSFLHQFTEGQNFTSLQLVLSHLKLKLGQQNESPLDPKKILQTLNENLPQQPKLQKDAFDKAFQSLKTISSSGGNLNNKGEEVKKGGNGSMVSEIEKTQSQKDGEIKKVTDEILKMFKLALDVKTRYREILMKILDSEHEVDENYFLIYYSKQFKDHFFNSMDKNKIAGQNRQWIYQKLQPMKNLKEIDYYMHPAGELAHTIYQNLDDKYYLYPIIEVQKAQQCFKDGEYKNVSDQLKMFSSPPINEEAAIIISSITEYINIQAKDAYDTMSNYMYDDLSLTEKNTPIIAQQSGKLLKINEHLGEIITIRGEKISSLIKDNVFDHLQKCFDHLSEKVDYNTNRLNFTNALKKIKDLNSFFKIIQQEAGNQMKDIEEYKLLSSSSKKASEKQEVVMKAIEDVIKTLVERDMKKVMEQPQARAVYEDIAKATEITEMPDYLQQIVNGLIGRYNQEKEGIEKALKQTEDADEFSEIEKQTEKLKETLTFMPIIVSDTIKPQLNALIESNRKLADLKQQKQSQDFQTAISSTKDPLQVASLLNRNPKKISMDQRVILTSNMSKQFQGLITVINDELNNFRLQEVIAEQIPKLQKEYLNDPNLAMLLNSDSQLAYTRVLKRINNMYQNAITELSKYFEETHATSGEIISNAFVSDVQPVKLPDSTNSLKIIRGILSCLSTHKELVERECVPDFEASFLTFLINATDYLRRIKILYQNGIINMVIQEAIAGINNIKYTNNLLANDQFRQTLNEKDGFCDRQRNELLEEIKQVSLEKMQREVNEQLTQVRNAVTNPKIKFVDALRSEADRADFYSSVQSNIDLLSLAQQTENHSLIKERQPSKIVQLFDETLKYCEDQIKNVVAGVTQINKKINDGFDITQDQFEQFGTSYISLKSIQQHLRVSRNFVEDSIEEIEGTLTRKLAQLKKIGKEFYGDSKNLNLNKLSLILCEIQQMRENMTLFEDQILKTMDQILEDYSQFRYKDPQAASNLHNELRGIPGSHGPTLASTHPFFKGVSILDSNKKFQSKKIDLVLEEVEGSDLRKEEKDQLDRFYNEFLAQYTAIIDEMLIVKRDDDGKRIPIDLTGIKSNIKIKLSSEASKKWCRNDIFGDIKFGKPVKDYKKLAILLANIFALWTLMNSEHYQKAEDMDAAQTNLKGYLLQPHVAQILSILRILGVGYASQYENGPKFNKNWSKVFGEKSDIRNNLVQIKTGEGKSVTLAVVSMIFALNGFEVKCACYSKYLSMRDYESFAPMFRELGLQELIKYGTFNEVAEYQINREGDVREILKSLVLKDEFQGQKPQIDLSETKRPQVLLIDEVDVFFSDDFYGQTYNPQALIQNEAISALTDYIWHQRQLKVEQIAKMSEEERELEKNKQPYMSLRALKDTQEYKNALNIFKPEYQFLVEEAAKKMIIDVVEYESPSHNYIMEKGMIGYENQDQISTNATIGYQTLFAYYYKNKLKEVTDDMLQSKKAIGLDCASFSYAEVPLEYDIILGVTGTLETLSKPQKDIIQQVYGIHHHTLSPSVHSSDDTKTFNRISGVLIVLDPSEYHMQIRKEIESKYLKFNRPVILFFENKKQLQQFADSDVFRNQKYQIINEKGSNKEKAILVQKATQARTITLATKNFGRGTDFCCYDKEVIEQGGLVVIQTFLSEDLSEETQIRGRTGRQGTSGTYLMILNLPDLSKFNIELEDILGSGKHYETLCEFRDKKLQKKQQETTKNRNALKIIHDQSNKMISQIKNTICKNEKLTDAKLKELTGYLLEMNNGVSYETEFQVMKVLVLIDCTSSMGITLQKTKNCVGAMFEEARNALKAMNLSEDLILMKIAGYRNYSSQEKEIFQVSPEWTSNPNSLTGFLNDTLKVHGGWGNEAIEIGLQYANKEIKNNQGVPLSMIIIIGDAPPNTVEDVQNKRNHVAKILQKNPKYWDKTKDYKKPTHCSTEIEAIKASEVPVHTFYVLNEKVSPNDHEKTKKNLDNEFKKLSVNGGKCTFLDIHDEAKGQEQLKEFFKYLIVYRATEINLGKDAALKSVQNMKVSFT